MGEAFIRNRRTSSEYVLLDAETGKKKADFDFTAVTGRAVYMIASSYHLYNPTDGQTFSAYSTRFDVTKYKKLHIEGYMDSTFYNYGSITFNLKGNDNTLISYVSKTRQTSRDISFDFQITNANKSPFYLDIHSVLGGSASNREAPNLILTKIKLTK